MSVLDRYAQQAYAPLVTLFSQKARKHLQNFHFLSQIFVPHARCPDKDLKIATFC